MILSLISSPRMISPALSRSCPNGRSPTLLILSAKPCTFSANTSHRSLDLDSPMPKDQERGKGAPSLRDREATKVSTRKSTSSSIQSPLSPFLAHAPTCPLPLPLITPRCPVSDTYFDSPMMQSMSQHPPPNRPLKPHRAHPRENDPRRSGSCECAM